MSLFSALHTQQNIAFENSKNPKKDNNDNKVCPWANLNKTEKLCLFSVLYGEHLIAVYKIITVRQTMFVNKTLGHVPAWEHVF